MIVRILTAKVVDRNAAPFEAVLRQQLPLMRQLDGLVYVKLARQAHIGYEEVLLFEEWRDASSLHAWAGDDLEQPRLLPGAERLAEIVKVTHYEALDRDPDELRATEVTTEEAEPDGASPSMPSHQPAAGSSAADTGGDE